MAAIDKVYVRSWDEYSKFRDWCKEQPKLKDKYGNEESITLYLYPWEKNEWKEGDCKPIFNAPYFVDAYVIRNCPFDFIQKEMMTNYGEWSQQEIKNYYEDVINWEGEGECPYWAKAEDFATMEDGTMTITGLDESDYSKILKGELFASPLTNAEYEVGTHFKCIKHPKYKYNRPFKCKSWFVDIETPEGMPYMWYHETSKTWDFSDEYVISQWSTSTANIKTIKSLMRHIRKWKLPVGTIVKATGRYISDNYEFVVKK